MCGSMGLALRTNSCLHTSILLIDGPSGIDCIHYVTVTGICLCTVVAVVPLLLHNISGLRIERKDGQRMK